MLHLSASRGETPVWRFGECGVPHSLLGPLYSGEVIPLNTSGQIDLFKNYSLEPSEKKSSLERAPQKYEYERTLNAIH